MGAYQYVAVDPVGKEHRGVLEGDTPRHVRQLLREKQVFPVEVAEVEQRERVARRQLSLRRGVSGLDLALLTRQLATLVRAGLPLEEALLAVSEQTEKARLQSIILGVRAKVLEGHSLAVEEVDGHRDGIAHDPRWKSRFRASGTLGRRPTRRAFTACSRRRGS